MPLARLNTELRQEESDIVKAQDRAKWFDKTHTFREASARSQGETGQVNQAEANNKALETLEIFFEHTT